MQEAKRQKLNNDESDKAAVAAVLLEKAGYYPYMSNLTSLVEARKEFQKVLSKYPYLYNFLLVRDRVRHMRRLLAMSRFANSEEGNHPYFDLDKNEMYHRFVSKSVEKNYISSAEFEGRFLNYLGIGKRKEKLQMYQTLVGPVKNENETDIEMNDDEKKGNFQKPLTELPPAGPSDPSIQTLLGSKLKVTSIFCHTLCISMFPSTAANRRWAGMRRSLVNMKRMVKNRNNKIHSLFKLISLYKHITTQNRLIIDDLTGIMVQKDTTLRDLKSTVDALEAKVDRKCQELTECQNKLKDSEAKQDKYWDELNECENKLEECEEERDKYREALAESQDKLEDSEAKLNKYREALTECQDKLEDSEAKVDNYQEALTKCEDKLKDSKKVAHVLKRRRIVKKRHLSDSD